MYSLRCKSVKELFRDLIRNQIKHEFGDLGERSKSVNESVVDSIQDKLWCNIIFNNKNSDKFKYFRKSIVGENDMISYLDKLFSNIAINNGHIDLKSDKINKIKQSKLTTFEHQFVSLLPLLIIGNKIIKHNKFLENDDLTLNILFILLKTYNAETLHFWNDIALINIFYSGTTRRLYSIIKNEIESKSKYDVRNDLPTFTSIIVTDIGIKNNKTEFWEGIFADLNICVDIFSYLYKDKVLNGALLFSNKTENMIESLFSNSTEISENVNKVAGFAFSGTKVVKDGVHNDKYTSAIINRKAPNDANKKKKESIIASFMGMGSDSEEDNFVYEYNDNVDGIDIEIVEKIEYDKKNNQVVGTIENNLPYLDNNNNNTKIASFSDKSKDCSEYNIEHKNYSSYNYFTKISDMVRIRENKRVEWDRFKLSHGSKTILPSLLSRASGRTKIVYNKNRLGQSWDQQYLELDKTNKLFNESILNVLTTERVKNCKIVFPDKETPNELQKNNFRYSCISLISIYRLFQGLPSLEFSLFPKYIRNKTLDYADIYTFNVHNDYISIKLNEDYGEFCPWMNNSGQGIKYIFHYQNYSMLNNSKNYENISEKLTKDKYIYISHDLLTRICIFGTKVYYLKSFLELLTVICDQINNGKIENKNSFVNSKIMEASNESVISLKILRSALMEFIKSYLSILKTIFDQIFVSNSDSNKMGTSIDIKMLLFILVPNINMLIKSFGLKPMNSSNTWTLPCGYSLLSRIYSYFWQLKLDKNWVEGHYVNEYNSLHSKSPINFWLHKSRSVMSDLLSNLCREIVGYQFNCFDKNIYDEINIENIRKKHVFTSTLFIFERIRLINGIISPNKYAGKESTMPHLLKLKENKNISNFCLYKEEINYSNKLSEFFSSDEYDFKSVDTNAKCESLMQYLKRYDLNFQDVYDLYHYKLENAYNWIINNKYKLNEFIEIAFYISDIIENIDEILFIDKIQLLDYIKSCIKLKLGDNAHFDCIHYMDNVNWIKDEKNDLYFKLLENYITANKLASSTDIIEFIIGLAINFRFQSEHKAEYKDNNLFKSEDVCSDNDMNIILMRNINNNMIEINEELIITKLFQLIILLNTVLKKYLFLRKIVNRIVLYIWCRRETTDFNLYINFSNGYLYDSLSNKNMILFWKIEQTLNLIYFNLNNILEYICIIMKDLDSLNIDSKNYDYYQKWIIVKRFQEKKLYSNASINQINFLFSLISTSYQIYLISYDIVSYFDLLISDLNIPKRPSSFFSRKVQVSSNEDNNILPNFINIWETNQIFNKVENLINILNCLKNQISENNLTFPTENSHIMYYLNSNDLCNIKKRVKS
ncbi:hypothetical protein RS030_3457 [Cryptosporidium xiaoi]|uniref:Uncharacterized protein n=1 Tax=Cryptosporidium xiaoi TaxID=659607 RepID=A0AAV9XXJ0_9CRYT